MDFAQLAAQVSRDADPGQPGFQPQVVYVALAVALPLVVGVLVSLVMGAAERVLGLRGSHH